MTRPRRPVRLLLRLMHVLLASAAEWSSQPKLAHHGSCALPLHHAVPPLSLDLITDRRIRRLRVRASETTHVTLYSGGVVARETMRTRGARNAPAAALDVAKSMWDRDTCPLRSSQPEAGSIPPSAPEVRSGRNRG
jgi:hypothetical protein